MLIVSFCLKFQYILSTKGMDAELLQGLDLSFMAVRREPFYIHSVFDRGFGQMLIALTRRYIINAFAVLTGISL